MAWVFAIFYGIARETVGWNVGAISQEIARVNAQ